MHRDLSVACKDAAETLLDSPLLPALLLFARELRNPASQSPHQGDVLKARVCWWVASGEQARV